MLGQKKFAFIIIIVLTSNALSGCARSKIYSESYTPSEETIRKKSNLSVVKAWNRWSESESENYVFLSGEPITKMQTRKLLEDDPNPKVHEALKSQAKWETAEKWSSIVGTSSLIVYILSFTGSKVTNKSPLGTTQRLIMGGLSVAGIGFGIYCNKRQDRYFETARAMHNERVWKVETKIDL